MFTFQSIMFVSLGFLCALLLGFVVAPAFWARAVRLTTERMRASLPLSEQEIAAERDRLRAENAIRVHQLTAKIERARLYDARQKVEINRRDGTISTLERRLQEIGTEREGSENARRVLEATITQRVPEIESRLIEARQLLVERDGEMKALQGDTAKTYRALDEAMQLNAQQRAEIDRLKLSIAGHGMTPSTTGGAESDVAMRTEVERLRHRSREQSALIDRLQLAARTGNPDKGLSREIDPVPLKRAAANDAGTGTDQWEHIDPTEAESKNEQALQSKVDEQAAKIEKLTAELKVYEQAAAEKGGSLSLRDTKTALKARAVASEKLVKSRDKSIAALRREIATANERLAQQASNYQNELRRLGSRSDAGSPSKTSANNSTTGQSIPPPVPPGAESSDATNSASSIVDELQQVTVSSNGRSSKADVSKTNEQTPPPIKSSKSKTAPSKPSEATPETAANKNDRPDSDTSYDFDQHFEPAQSEPKPEPRGKLMDRIAELAKR